jgi:DNA-directed RNA polymerase subunit RPC12/RpoP
MAKLSESRCPNCKAPIEFDAAAQSVQCRYCQTVIQISKEKAPANIDVSSPQRPMVIYSGNSGWVIGRLVWIAVVVFLSGGGFAANSFRRTGCAPSASLPTTCGLNDDILIKGKTFDGAGPVIVAGLNCKITIEDSTISSPDVIVKSDAPNVEVTVINSKLTTKSGSHAAIELSMNGKIRVSKGSVIKSDGSAVEGDTNLELTVNASTLEGDVAAKMGGNGKVTLGTGSVLKGKKAALDANGNLKLRAEGASLESAGPGVKAGSNADVKMDAQCKIAASPPFALGGNPQLDVPAGLSAPAKPALPVAPKTPAGKPSPAPTKK